MLTAPQTLRHLEPFEFPVAGALTGRALRDNPVFLKMLPSNPGKRSGALGEIYAVILKQVAAHGKVVGAFEGNTLVGVGALSEPGRCQPSTGDKLSLGRTISSVTSMGTALTFQRWQGALARRDPEHRHWHVQFVVVEPNRQRCGVGTVLMRELCRSIDATHEPAFVESDQPNAVDFFTKFGFKEYLKVTVCNVAHTFLLRSPE